VHGHWPRSNNPFAVAGGQAADVNGVIFILAVDVMVIGVVHCPHNPILGAPGNAKRRSLVADVILLIFVAILRSFSHPRGYDLPMGCRRFCLLAVIAMSGLPSADALHIDPESWAARVWSAKYPYEISLSVPSGDTTMRMEISAIRPDGPAVRSPEQRLRPAGVN
jgi:hypothetical protein